MTLPQLCLAAEGAAPTLAKLTSSLATVPSCASRQERKEKQKLANNNSPRNHQADKTLVLQLSCLVTSVAQANCSAADPQCPTNGMVKTEIAQSTDAKCRFNSQVTKNLTETVCNRPIRDKSGQYDAMNLSMGIITCFIVVVRLLYKQFFSYQRKLSYDDWAIMWTVILGVPCTIINTAGLTAHGLGRDVWTIPPSTLTVFVEYFFIIEVIYLAEMAIVKLSLSLFYLAIFPGKTIRRLLMATCILNVLYGVAFVTAGIFACTPVSRYWTQYVEKDSVGYCIDLNLFAWLHGAFNVVLDVWMIALPLSQVKGLEMHWKKKFGVVVMFLMGTFVTIVTILRLQSLIYFSNSTNPTWDNWIIGWWSTIEVNVGMICTCLPTLRLMLVRVAPRIFSTNGSKNESHCTPNSHGSSRRHSNALRNKPFDISSIEMSAVEERRWKDSV
ncbi:hypothetical protein E4U55_006536 [Claviceps digitariae]|nr:hypothetical protein E4U55_006536 [Claviceps digitariae]